MAIEKVNISFRKALAGDECLATVPKAWIRIRGQVPKALFLDSDSITQENLRGVVVCNDFFAVMTSSEYIIYSEDGECTGRVGRRSAGRVVMAFEDTFVCLRGNILSEYGREGGLVRRRAVPDEVVMEINSWKRINH